MNQTSNFSDYPAKPETVLLVQIVQAFLSQDYSNLKKFLAQPIDWQEFNRLAEYHCITLPVAYVLLYHGGDVVPASIKTHLQQQLIRARQVNMIWLSELHRILRAFESAGIGVISVKGPAFALQAYGNLSLREFTDLDLLVLPQDVPSASAVLLREGYRLLLSASGHEANLLRSENRQLDFINDASGTAVDLHWALLHTMFPYQLETDRLFTSAKTACLDGNAFLTLSSENLLLYLCAHGTKHCWIHLRSLCDVACHLRSAGDLDWEACFHLAEETHSELVLKHSLLLAQNVLGVKLPEIAERYCEDSTARALASGATAFLFSENTIPGQKAFLRYQLAFTKNWRQRLHFLFHRMVVPAEADWAWIRLPRSFHLLYYVLRPIRYGLEAILKKRRKKTVR